MPQIKEGAAPHKVTVECPICGEVVEVKGYNHVTRTEALKRHIESKHSTHDKMLRKPPKSPGMLPQVLIEGGDPVPPQYRDLVGFINEPLPGYSLMTLLPVVEIEPGEKKIDAVMRQLKAGVEGIVDSQQFRLFLTAMSRFHDYSIGNQILIMMQRPDATRVAGFNTWKDMERWVKAGEKGIAILAPVFPPRATCPKCGARLPRDARFCQKCGETVVIEMEVSPRFFRVVHVFDLA
ncbi:ArdC family protein, partial [Chloroflexota bacterium]